MFLTETLDANTTARICADGCLVADVKAARVGIQQYTGREVDPDNAHGLRDKAIVNVYRPENEVFSRDSMASYAGAHFTVDHPPVMVDADNWRTYGRGEVNGDIARDGEAIRVPIIVRDASAVKAASTTHKQLSAGYSCSLDFTPGEFRGETYDAIQRDIRINHIAAVRNARGGPELRIVDERIQEPPMNKKIMIDGLQVDLSDASAVETAIGKLQGQIGSLTTAKDAAETQVATLTTEKATLDAKVTTLEKQVTDAKLTPQQLRDAAKAYALVVDKTKGLGVTVTDAMDEPAIMKAVVDAKVGDAAKDWTDVQIAASFATLTKDVKAADATVHSIGTPLTVADADKVVSDAYADMIADMKAPGAKAA